MKGKTAFHLGLSMFFFLSMALVGQIKNIQFVQDLSISSSGQEGISTFEVSGVEADSKGNMYILDRQNKRVLKFDQEGKYVQTISGEGHEPGELDSPSFLYIDDGDKIYVHDMAKKALVVFDEGGIFFRDIEYDSSDIFLLYKIEIDSRDNIICGYLSFSEGTGSQEYRISRFDSQFKHLSDIYVRRDVFMRKEIRRGSVVFSLQAPPYTPKVHWTMDFEGRIFVNYSNAYRIKILSREGTLIEEIRRDPLPEKVSPNEATLIRARYGERTREFIDSIPFPEVKPPVSGLYLVEGYLFVRKSELGNSYVYDIYDRDFAYFGTLPLGFTPVLNKNGFVYTYNMGGELKTGEAVLTELIRYKINTE
jgi:hypothetical protein